MHPEWPLILFTFFLCVAGGALGAQGLLNVMGKGKKMQLASLVTALAALVVGGLSVFMHLQHWERIFNGFGHITSGITQELIGCVALAVIIVAWFVVLRGGKEIPKALAWITLAVAVLMLVATGHSYLMPARPAWGIALVVFYVANACLLGAVAMWLISIMKKDEASEGSSIQFALVGSVVQLAAMAVYTIACSMTKFADFGFYADPTSMTTAPTHVDSLLAIMVSGDGALMFWCSIACAVVALVCAIAAKKKVGASKPYMIIAVIVAIASSILFRVLFYQLGFAMVLLY